MALKPEHLQALKAAVQQAKTDLVHTPTCDDEMVKISTRHNREGDEVVVEFKQPLLRSTKYEWYEACRAQTSLTVYTTHDPEGYCFAVPLKA